MTQYLIAAGVLWAGLSVAVGLWFGAVAKDPAEPADDLDWLEDWNWPPRIDQRRD